jgi:hypothetical protein
MLHEVQMYHNYASGIILLVQAALAGSLASFCIYESSVTVGFIVKLGYHSNELMSYIGGHVEARKFLFPCIVFILSVTVICRVDIRNYMLHEGGGLWQ